MKLFFISIVTVTCLLLNGCGFHLRGAAILPPSLKTMRIEGCGQFDPFIKTLKQTLKTNDVCVLDENDRSQKSVVLTVLHQGFSERTLAFGSDGQTNRVLYQFSVTYQVSDMSGKLIISPTTLQAERELSINPNAVLNTNNERERLKPDLYVDVISQIMRQLSAEAK